jgi:hypothetical protein
MKMVSLFDGIFWGIVLIVLGVWLLVRRSVPVHIPVIRIIIAALFVYIGVRVLIWGPSIREKNTAVFSQTQMVYGGADRENEYNVVFGTGDVDLTGARVSERSVGAQVNVIFGSGVLRIDPAVPVRIHMSAAFGSVHAPNGRSVAFGDTVYTTPAFREGAPALEVKAAAVFGSLRIVQ